MACLPWTLPPLFPSTLKRLLYWSVSSIHFILAGNLRLDSSRKLLPSFMLFMMWITACVCSRRWRGHSVPCSPGSWAPSLWGEMSLWAVCLFLNIKAKTHNNRNYCVILRWEQGSIMMHIKFRNILGALYIDAACALLVWLSGLLVHFICLAMENALWILAVCHRTWGFLLNCTQLFLGGGCREWWYNYFELQCRNCRVFPSCHSVP